MPKIRSNGSSVRRNHKTKGKFIMKKLLSAALAVCLLFSVFCLTVFAEESSNKSANVFVTISDKGALAVAYEKITVTDIDNDGTLTINDALYCAHETKYNGGAAAGYSSAMSAYGLSIVKLWNDESGNFGYYLNDASAWSLTDAVNEGDYVCAFVYKNADFSDKYSFFDKNTVSCDQNDEISLTLKYAGYDEQWNPVVLPLANATITVNGVATEYKTDAEGKVTVKVSESGNVVISATSETDTLVPPVCMATVEADEPEVTDEPSNNTVLIVCIVAAVVIAAGVAVFVILKRKANEK